MGKRSGTSTKRHAEASGTMMSDRDFVMEMYPNLYISQNSNGRLYFWEDIRQDQYLTGCDPDNIASVWSKLREV